MGLWLITNSGIDIDRLLLYTVLQSNNQYQDGIILGDLGYLCMAAYGTFRTFEPLPPEQCWVTIDVRVYVNINIYIFMISTSMSI